MTIYKTSDMNFASILYYSDKKIVNIEKDNKRANFLFEDDGTIDELKLKFIRRELLVEPYKLWESLKAIKQILYGEI